VRNIRNNFGQLPMLVSQERPRSGGLFHVEQWRMRRRGLVAWQSREIVPRGALISEWQLLPIEWRKY
jgi:hypothetical protein